MLMVAHREMFNDAHGGANDDAKGDAINEACDYCEAGSLALRVVQIVR